MYVIFLQCTHCVKKTLTVSCTLLCESGDRVMVDQSSFSADLHAVMLRHHCSEYGLCSCLASLVLLPGLACALVLLLSVVELLPSDHAPQIAVFQIMDQA